MAWQKHIWLNKKTKKKDEQRLVLGQVPVCHVKAFGSGQKYLEVDAKWPHRQLPTGRYISLPSAGWQWWIEGRNLNCRSSWWKRRRSTGKRISWTCRLAGPPPASTQLASCTQTVKSTVLQSQHLPVLVSSVSVNFLSVHCCWKTYF